VAGVAGAAGLAVAGGLAGRAVLRRGRDAGPHESLALQPPDDLGIVRSFDGTDLAVRAAGEASAPMLLFVHGFSLDLTSWHYQWTGLSDRFRCVLFDLRWHGQSGRPPTGDVSLAAFGHDVGSVLDEVAPDRPVVLVAHSMGGMATLALAESRPELFGPRIAGVVLLGTAASDLLRGVIGSARELVRPRLGTMTQAAARVNRIRQALLAGGADMGHVVARLTQFGPDPPAHVVDHIVGLASRSQSGLWTDGLAGMMELDLRHAIHRVKVPTLVTVGDRDHITPPSLSVALASELPDGRLELIERAGHMAMLERHEEFNDLVATFASEVLVEGNRVSRQGRAT
jgi:pimeloyl-ACP methyl ester carboxylesterase